jgi:Tol biopolymer transport system component
MSGPRAFDERLNGWLQEGPEAAPSDLLESILGELPGIRQERRIGPFRYPRFGPGRRPTPVAARLVGAAAAVVAVAAVASVLLVPGQQPPFGGGPSPSPTSTPTSTPTPTPTVMRTLDPRLSPSPEGTFVWDPCRPPQNPTVSVSGTGFDARTVHGWIAYRSGTSIMAVDPAEPEKRVVLAPSLQADPTFWSRDGSRLLLVGEAIGSPLGQPAPVVLDSDGSALRLTDWGWGAFSPDGTTVVYSVPGGGLCLVGSDGSAPQLLAFDMAEPLDGGPAWSPDGSIIAWLDFVEDSPAYGHHAFGLSFIKPDGSGLRQLALRLPGEGDLAAGLGWSPDGARLAYSVAGQIHVVNGDATGSRQITTDEGLWPTWSPDGSRIAFVRSNLLYTMRPDGTDVRLVPGANPDGSIAWNPVP